MVQTDLEGTRLLYSSKDWNRAERRKVKQKKIYEWSSRGCFITPIFVPPTPNNELANSLKVIAESEADAEVHFKMVETGGLSIKSVLQRSNPLETPGCNDEVCLPCEPGRGAGGQGDSVKGVE